MNVAVLNLNGATVDQISEHVINYGSMTIPEMLFIDEQLQKATKNKYSLVDLLNQLIDKSENDKVNNSLLSRIRNNYEFYKEIYDTITVA